MAPSGDAGQKAGELAMFASDGFNPIDRDRLHAALARTVRSDALPVVRWALAKGRRPNEVAAALRWADAADSDIQDNDQEKE